MDAREFDGTLAGEVRKSKGKSKIRWSYDEQRPPDALGRGTRRHEQDVVHVDSAKIQRHSEEE